MNGPGIGGELTRAREQRGRTIEDAERDTRISQRYLRALEDERFDVIPAPVYARGFLRSYAQYLGLDPGPLLARFPREAPAPGGGSAERPGAGPSAGAPARFFPPREPTIGVDIGLAGGRGRMRGGPIPGARAVTVALVAVFVTAVVILLAFVVANLGGGESAPAPPTPAAATPAPAATPAAGGVDTEIGIVPDVIGQTEAVARQAVREAGFEVNVVTERNEQYPRGTVFEQAPAPGVRREPGRGVFIVVSAGP